MVEGMKRIRVRLVDMNRSVVENEVHGPWQRYGWLMSVIWLVFLYFPIRSLVAVSAHGALLVAGWLGIVLFTLAYFVGFVLGMRVGWRRPTRLVMGLYLLAIGGAALTIPAIGWEAASFLPFLMSYAAYCIGTRWHWGAVIASIVIMTFDTVFALARSEQPSWLLIGIVLMMAAVNTINTWLIDRSIATDELRMELATSEERESVARDVHDLLGHSLTVVKLKAELAMRLMERDPAAARTELEEVVQITGEAISGVRSTVTGLRVSGFEEQLGESRAALESAGVSLTVSGESAALSPAQSLTAAWILREATTNVLRHASAAGVRVSVEPGTLRVEDDGVGIRGRGRAGNGLRGMSERAAAAGAELQVSRRGDGPGTRVSLTW